MPTTSPDNLWSPDNSDNFEDLVSDLATMQGSVQTALSSRAIRTYKWASTTARNAQTGMTEGDIGYQLDNDTLYVYSGSAWDNLVPPLPTVVRGTYSTGSFTSTGNLSTTLYWGTFSFNFPSPFVSPPALSISNSMTGQVSWVQVFSVSNTGVTARVIRAGTSIAATDFDWTAVGVLA